LEKSVDTAIPGVDSRIGQLVPASTVSFQYQPVFSAITPLIPVSRGGREEKRVITIDSGIMTKKISKKLRRIAPREP
jgi:hypothetical protein